MSVLHAWLAVAVAAAALPSAAAQESAAPEEYQCMGPNHPTFALVYEVECGLGTQAWQLLWYYPPGVYQAWCLVVHDCPCPHCPPAADTLRT